MYQPLLMLLSVIVGLYFGILVTTIPPSANGKCIFGPPASILVGALAEVWLPIAFATVPLAAALFEAGGGAFWVVDTRGDGSLGWLFILMMTMPISPTATTTIGIIGNFFCTMRTPNLYTISTY